jgi:hypothetical protein
MHERKKEEKRKIEKEERKNRNRIWHKLRIKDLKGGLRVAMKKFAPFIRKTIARALIFSLALAAAPVHAFADNILSIGTPGELVQFAQNVNNGNTYINTKVFLTSDIDLSANSNWPAIGNIPARYFGGSFDGQNHTISGLTVKNRTLQKAYVGLFGSLKGATIQNLFVETSATGITADSRIGILAGLISDSAPGQTTLIDNVHVKGTVIANQEFVGAMIGEIWLTQNNTKLIIQNSSAQGAVSTLTWGAAGGFIGALQFSNYNLTGSHIDINNNSVDVSVSCKTLYAGGFASVLNSPPSRAKAVIDNCTVSGSVLCKGYRGDSRTGGFVGTSLNFEYANCAVSSVSVNGNGSNVGGFCGLAQNSGANVPGSFINCHTGEDDFSLSTAVTGSGSCIGGFVGQALKTPFIDCYASGSVVSGSGSVNATGGFAGYINGTRLENCHSNAGVFSQGHDVGGFVGLIYSSTVLDSYALGGAVSTKGLGRAASVTYANKIGAFAGSSTNSLFQNCYASGYVYGANCLIGAFFGYLFTTSSTTVSNCFYDSTSAQYGLPVTGGYAYNNAALMKGSPVGASTKQIYSALGLTQ